MQPIVILDVGWILIFCASKNEVQPKTFSAAKCLVVVDIVDTVPELNDLD
jgi:hypothetical protein